VRPEARSTAAVRLIAAAVLAALASAAAWGSSGLAASGASPLGQHPERSCAVPPHLAKGQIVVAVVVDFGGVDAKVLVSCVTARTGETGAEVLQAQGRATGYPTPRYDESGLLCAIDGYPTSGCGAQSGGHYAYWAYWHGGKRWRYANDGPGEWTVARGDVEGWRFEPDGSASPSDPPPRAASSASGLETSAATVRGATTTTSTADGAGPIASAGTGSSTRPILFFACLALIVLLGAGALIRARRAHGHVT
jgi:hypothetical protein